MAGGSHGTSDGPGAGLAVVNATPATTARPQRRAIAYWVVTAVVVGEAAVGGAMDLFRMPPFYSMMMELGYPGYLAAILGTAKIIAAVVLLAPGLPRLKEWAYAGVVINMVGAIASHAAMRHSIGDVIAPAVFAGLAILSWAWRPPTRRL
jgi:multisubunit Na+/H+ antiporter MnhG subunit